MMWQIFGVFGFIALVVWFAYRAGRKAEKVEQDKVIISQIEANQKALERWIEANDKLTEENKSLRKELHLVKSSSDVAGVLKKARGSSAKIVKAGATG